MPLLVVHPRICGEHLPLGLTYEQLIGSSPHLRGTSNSRAPKAPQYRFIPASAGNI